MLKADPHLTAKGLSDKIGITQRSIENNIKALKKCGLLIRQGADRGGYWEVVS